MTNEICGQKIAQLKQACDEELQEKNVLALNKLINYLEHIILLQNSYSQYNTFCQSRHGTNQEKWLDDTNDLLPNLMTSILNIVNADPFLFHPWLDANYDVYQQYFTPTEMAILKEETNKVVIDAIRTLAGKNNVTRTEAGFEAFLSIMRRVDEKTRIFCLHVCMRGFNSQWSKCSQEWLIEKLDAYDSAWRLDKRDYTPPGCSAVDLGQSMSNVWEEKSADNKQKSNLIYDSTNTTTERSASLLKNIF